MDGGYLLEMAWGYLITIAIESPVLWVGLARVHAFGRRFFAGIWLTACTYPIVWLTLPAAMGESPRWLYLLVAETFAPVAECILFYLAFDRRQPWRVLRRDLLAITVANLLSFGIPEVWRWASQ